MADGNRFKTIETQISQLSEVVNTQMRNQLQQLTETVASHSASITDTASTLRRMKTLLQSLSPPTVTHGSHNAHDQSFHVRNVCLEFPHFDGSDTLA